MSSKKLQFILLCTIFLAAVVLRLSGLTWGLPTKTLSLTTYHPDEAYMFQVFENIYNTRSLHPGRVGLLYGTFFFYLSGFFLFLAKILGIIVIGSRDFLLQNLPNLDRMYLTIRLFSVACGVASVIGIYFLAKRLLDQNAGIWSAFFLAFSPIAIATSHYAKVDVLLPLLVIILLWQVFDLMEKPGWVKASLCGLTVGLLASTKYNAGIFLFTPLLALFFSSADKKLILSLHIILSSLLGFLLTTPYSILDFPLFLDCLREQSGMVDSGGTWNFGKANGFWMYSSYYIPFAIGWFCWILSLSGFFLTIVNRNKEKIVFLLSFLILFALMLRTTTRLTAYTSPLLPFLVIFAATAIHQIHLHRNKILKFLLLFSIAIYQILYGTSFSRLFSQPDTRELSANWILENVSTDKPIGIIRSYFWTPGLLRQAHPPYTIIKAGDDQIALDRSVLGLSAMRPLPPYFVESELETREFIRLEKLQPAYAETLRNFFSHYQVVEIFELNPKIFKIALWRRTPPWDFSMIAPTMRIFKKIS